MASNPGMIGRTPRPSAWSCLGLGVWLICWLSGCQTYSAEPLELSGALDAFLQRSLEPAGIEAALGSSGEGSLSSDFDLHDGVSLFEGRLVALAYHPAMRRARLDWERFAEEAEWAGALSDPVLEADLLRVTQSVPEPWIAGLGARFRIPVTGRRGAERGAAQARIGVAQADLLQVAWEVERDVRLAWLSWSFSAAKLRIAEAFVEQLAPLEQRANLLAQSGELDATEAGLFGLERTHQQGWIAELSGRVIAQELRVRATLGLAPEAPVMLQPQVNPLPGPVEQPAGFPFEHPHVRVLTAAYTVAEEELRLEVARQWSDLVLGPRVESEDDTFRLGFLGALPLPLWNGNGPGIATARANRKQARLNVELEIEKFTTEWATTRAERSAVEARHAWFESELVPLMDQQLERARSRLKLGDGSTLAILQSLTRAQELAMEQMDLREEIARTSIQLEYLAGPFPALPDRQAN